MENKQSIDIKRDFSIEYCNVANKLRQLEQGIYFEKTHQTNDGYISTHIAQLKKYLSELFLAIEGKRPSMESEFEKYFSQI